MRVLLFGVDGLTFRILHPYMERGLLPNFQRIRAEGSQAILQSTTPPMTPPAWMSIATGLPPAGHGVYDFWEFERKEGVPVARVVTHRKGGKAIWNILSEWGKQVIVANVPLTYPPEPVNGIMVSGYMAPDMQSDVTYPMSFKEELLRVVPEYQIDLHPAVSGGQAGDVLAETVQMTRKRNEMLRLLLDKPWDFLFIGYTGADRIQHLRWDSIMNFHPQAVAYYQLVDDALGMVLAELRPEDLLMIVSDHGFQGVHHTFYLQEFLHRQGLLRMKNSNARRNTELMQLAKSMAKTILRRFHLLRYYQRAQRQLGSKGILATESEHHAVKLPDLDWSNARAALLSNSGALGGYADIFLDEMLTEEEINELQAALQAVCEPESGQPLLASVHREDVLGAGPYAPAERHLIVLPAENTLLSNKLGLKSLWETSNWSMGIHHPDGVLYLYGAQVKRGKMISPVHLFDIVPTILSRMDVPLPDNLAGTIMEEAFEQLPSEEPTLQENDIVKQKLKRLASRTN